MGIAVTPLRGGRRRRRRLLTRAAPLAIVAVAAFVAGAIFASSPGRAERRVVTEYARDWARGDYRGMYALLDSDSRAHMSQRKFAGKYTDAAYTSTLTKLAIVGVGRRRGNLIPVQMLATTRLFGVLHETLEVPVVGSGSTVSVRFSRELLFPGMRPGERLHRQVDLAPRAALLASDGTPLAEGPGRTSPIPDVAGQIVGTVGSIPAGEAASYAARGYPPDAKVGLDGLERIFQKQLAGTPGGSLMSGRRILALTPTKPGHDVHTTINPTIERAAITAIAGRYAGMTAMDPRNGRLLAVAGVGFSALQPPGSTMKIITATGALEAGIVKLSTVFPVASAAVIDGYTLHNAGGEVCGGTFLNAFAVSCNSVFAPLGAKLGAKRFVDVAQRFGFDQAPSIPGAAESQIPSANDIGSDLAVGSSAIGQGKVLASSLEMTDVAATIAMGGRRPIPTLQAHKPGRFVHVTSKRIARLVQKLMIAVVEFGTGTSAQIPGVPVAGKTGTAELKDTNNPNDPTANSPQNTDSWFVGYAPVGKPRVVVGALFPAQGAGAATAAPAVHDVLEAALQAHH
ncbi:MAG TPA: penicillin-binding transpeptidase domain-containing protein [Solirubrobacteraceae bacterium]|nr:penicillin-binding transpeptidase domain-containing protein [Solirubrobacteraceae bacterium]